MEKPSEWWVSSRNNCPKQSMIARPQRTMSSGPPSPSVCLHDTGSLLSHDPVDVQIMAEDPSTEFQCSEEIRHSAQQAIYRSAGTSRVRLTARARSRAEPQMELRAGDAHCVWRKNVRSHMGGCIGPGVIVVINANRSRVWVALRGQLAQVQCRAGATGHHGRTAERRTHKKTWTGRNSHIWIELVSALRQCHTRRRTG